VDAGPIVEIAPPPVAVPEDADGAVYVVTDATGELEPGVGAGYSITYDTGGHWHVRWTCDSAVSGGSCLFDGAVSAAAGDVLTSLAPTNITAPENVWLEAGGMDIGFSALATVSVDGFDFDATPGAKVAFDVLIDGWRRIEFVLFPSGDPALGDLYAASPRFIPVVLQPTVP
jgi:hypothetical protein